MEQQELDNLFRNAGRVGLPYHEHFKQAAVSEGAKRFKWKTLGPFRTKRDLTASELETAMMETGMVSSSEEAQKILPRLGGYVNYDGLFFNRLEIFPTGDKYKVSVWKNQYVGE